MSVAARHAIDWTEQGYVPDAVIRAGIRRLLHARLEDLQADSIERALVRTAEFVAQMDRAPIAPLPDKAREQHYEVPTEFFARVLGPRLKYSACLWNEGIESLAEAELAALETTCRRAGIADGQNILELGCGWGSLSLYLAEKFPDSRITAVSNSDSQRQYILGQAAWHGLSNLQVITRDMNDFDIDQRFDRIVSVEMFEHMRNYRQLFGRVARWLNSDGRFFLHIFCHRNSPYEFEDRGPDDWMGRHFFSGGMMPSAALPLHFQDDLRIVTRWAWNGNHYERTANAWLANLDAHRGELLALMERTYGVGAGRLWLQRWRIFLMACAELWGFRGGEEWFVGHYLFAARR